MVVKSGTIENHRKLRRHRLIGFTVVDLRIIIIYTCSSITCQVTWSSLAIIAFGFTSTIVGGVEGAEGGEGSVGLIEWWTIQHG